MAARQLPLPGKTVKKSNALCRASWSADGVWEARLIAIVASKVNVNDREFQEYEIPISEIFQGTHKDGDTYSRLDETTERLMNRLVRLPTEDGGVAKYNVFSKCVISPSRNYVIARFDPDLKPHFLQLRDRFTEMNLWEFLMLPSIYSQRIFEILKSWSDKPEITISLEELFDMLEVSGSMKRYPDFRRKVLEKAHKDISRTSLEYEWEPVKQGRAVIAIRFIFNKKAIEAKEFCDKTMAKPKNNKFFKDALTCATNRRQTGGCKKQDNKPQVCDICKQLRMIEIKSEEL